MNKFNRQFPINIKHLAHIIDRVSVRYPASPKSEIVMVAKAFFESMREILVQGDKLSVRELMSHAHLLYYSLILNGKFTRKVRIKLTTSKNLSK